MTTELLIMELEELESKSDLYDSIILWCKILGGVIATATFLIGTYAHIKKKSLSKTIKNKKQIIETLKKEEQDDRIFKLENKLLELSSIIKTIKDLSLSEDIANSLFTKYQYNTSQIDSILKGHKKNVVGKLDQALWYFSNNDMDNALNLFKELLNETTSLEVEAISNAYLGSIYNYQNKSDLSIICLEKAKKIFNKIDNNDESLILVKASNYYRLAFYYKTKTTDWNKAKDYYLKSIDLYEKLDELVNDHNNILLGQVYNDLYVMRSQSLDANENDLAYLEKAIDIKKKVFERSNDIESFQLYLNSLKIEGNYYFRNEEYEKALSIYESTIELSTSHFMDDEEIQIFRTTIYIKISNLHQTLFKTSKNPKHLLDAHEYLKKSREVFEKLPTNWPLYTVIAIRSYYYSEGTWFRNQNLIDKSIKSFNDCLELNSKLISQLANDTSFIEYQGHIYYEIAKTYSMEKNAKNCKLAIENAKYAIKHYENLTEVSSKSLLYSKKCKDIISECK